MDYKIIKDEEGFLAEKEAWTALYHEKSALGTVTPFQSWEWCYYWWKYREDKDSLFIVKAFSERRIEGYAPLIVKNSMVEFIGGRDMDYGRFLIRDNYMVFIQGVISEIEKNKYGFALQEMASSDTQLHITQKCLENHKKYLCHKTTRTSFIDIKNHTSIEDYCLTLSGKFRKQLRKSAANNVVIKKAVVTNEVLIILQDIFADRQKERGGSNRLEWAMPIIKELSINDLIEIYIAYVDEKAAAYHVCFNNKFARYVWLIAHRHEYEKLNLGKLMRYHILRASFDEGYNQLNNMRGDYPYKMEWNVELDTNYTVYVYPTRWKYMKSKMIFWLRPKVKKIVYGNKLLKRFYKKHAK